MTLLFKVSNFLSFMDAIIELSLKINIKPFNLCDSSSSSSSICTATLVGFGLLNYRWVFSAGWFLQSSVASGTSNPNLEDLWLERSNSRHQVFPRLKQRERNPAAEDGTMGEKLPRNCREFCRKWRLPHHTWVLLHAVNYDMGPTALLPLRRKARWGFFRLKNPAASAGFEPANLGTEGQHAYL